MESLPDMVNNSSWVSKIYYFSINESGKCGQWDTVLMLYHMATAKVSEIIHIVLPIGPYI
jgi:hypothetical protein